MGGDEFAVLLGEPAPDVSAVLATLVATLDRPVPMHGLDLQVTASIGAGVSRAGDSVEDLLHAADTAMYTDKTRVDRRRAETIPLVPAPRTTAA